MYAKAIWFSLLPGAAIAGLDHRAAALVSRMDSLTSGARFTGRRYESGLA